MHRARISPWNGCRQLGFRHNSIKTWGFRSWLGHEDVTLTDRIRAWRKCLGGPGVTFCPACLPAIGHSQFLLPCQRTQQPDANLESDMGLSPDPKPNLPTLYTFSLPFLSFALKFIIYGNAESITEEFVFLRSMFSQANVPTRVNPMLTTHRHWAHSSHLSPFCSDLVIILALSALRNMNTPI